MKSIMSRLYLRRELKKIYKVTVFVHFLECSNINSPIPAFLNILLLSLLVMSEQRSAYTLYDHKNNHISSIRREALLISPLGRKFLVVGVLGVCLTGLLGVMAVFISGSGHSACGA